MVLFPRAQAVWEVLCEERGEGRAARKDRQEQNAAVGWQ